MYQFMVGKHETELGNLTRHGYNCHGAQTMANDQLEVTAS